MSKIKNGKTYNNVLTVLLIIVIIAVIGLLIFFGYKAFVKYDTEKKDDEATEEFRKNIEKTLDDFKNDIEKDDGDAIFVEDETNNSNSTAGRSKTYLDGYEVKGIIEIKKTGIEYCILENASVGALSKAVGILAIQTCSEINTTVKELNVPGTNAYINGHNYRNGQFFSDNYKLEIGDKIYITDTTGTKITYTIYNMYYAAPNDTTALERELDPNVREITLQTCNDDSSQVLIIWAKE